MKILIAFVDLPDHFLSAQPKTCTVTDSWTFLYKSIFKGLEFCRVAAAIIKDGHIVLTSGLWIGMLKRIYPWTSTVCFL